MWEPQLTSFGARLPVVTPHLPGFGGTAGSRWLTLIFGVLFAGYAFYLNFIFDGTSYIMPIYAYIAPFLLIYYVFKSRSDKKKEAAAAAAAATAPPAPPAQPPVA